MIQEEIQVFKFPSLRRFAQQAQPSTQCGRHWTEKATAVDRRMSVFFKVPSPTHGSKETRQRNASVSFFADGQAQISVGRAASAILGHSAVKR